MGRSTFFLLAFTLGVLVKADNNDEDEYISSSSIEYNNTKTSLIDTDINLRLVVSLL